MLNYAAPLSRGSRCKFANGAFRAEQAFDFQGALYICSPKVVFFLFFCDYFWAAAQAVINIDIVSPYKIVCKSNTLSF